MELRGTPFGDGVDESEAAQDAVDDVVLGFVASDRRGGREHSVIDHEVSARRGRAR